MAGMAHRTSIIALCALVAAAPPVAAQLINVQTTNPADGGGVTVSALGSSQSGCISLLIVCATGISISGTSTSSGGIAVSGGGQANGTFFAASLLAPANSDGITYTTQGNSTGKLAAISAFGNASCGGQWGCYAVSLTGEADGGLSGCTVLMSAALGAMCGEGWYATASDPMSLLG